MILKKITFDNIISAYSIIIYYEMKQNQIEQKK